MIETRVEGSPSSVRAAATFIGETLRDGVDRAGTARDKARSTARAAWDGDSAEAYRDFTARLVKAGDEQLTDLADAAEKLRAYAGKLERMQDRMQDRRAEAHGGGLKVAGSQIQEPDPAVRPDDLPAGATPAESDAWDAKNAAFAKQNDRIELYNRLVDEVLDDWDRLEEWVTANLQDFWTRAKTPSLASLALDELKVAPATLAGLVTDLHGQQLEELAKHWEKSGADLAGAAQTALSNRRSGHPGRKAAARNFDIQGARGEATALADAAKGAKRLARGIPLIGVGLSVGLAANDIAHGESPSSVGVGEVAAVVAGGAATVALVAVGAPVIAVVGGAAIVGVGASMAATYAYEELVPQDVREAFDDGLKEFGNDVADIGRDVGGGAKKAWDKVSFWD